MRSGLGAGAWFSFPKEDGMARALLCPVFLFCVLRSWQAPYRDARHLEPLAVSLDYRSYVVVRLVYGALDPSTVLGGLWLVGMAIGIGIANSRLFPWAAFVLLLFGILNVLLTQMVFAWVERWLAQRRTREIFGVLFFLVMIGFQLVGPMMNRYGSNTSPF